MKKILTLLIAMGAFATLHAQSREETRRVILGERRENGENENHGDRDVVLGRDENRRYPARNSSDGRYRTEQINREYDDKIASIRNNRYLNNEEKERAIRQLERDRQRRLSEIDRNNDDRYDRDRRYDNDRSDRRDNGKHKGWYKKNKNKNWKKGKRDRDWDDE